MEDERTIERDEKGRLRKGSVLNPHAIHPRLARMKKQLEGLTPFAVARLGSLLRSENEAVALGAVKEVLDRNFGKAKQQVSVDVQHTHVAHLEALRELAERSRGTIGGYNAPQVIDVTPVATIDGLSQHPVEGAPGALEFGPAGGDGAGPPGPHPPPGAGSGAAPPPPTHEKPTTALRAQYKPADGQDAATPTDPTPDAPKPASDDPDAITEAP
jgi:hypothetical protein